ncbi:MAG: nucleotidyltransferase family protein [Bacteroidota bacterium]|nr:nucleotidyltransferase family protein [Bacteroidota bacterium]
MTTFSMEQPANAHFLRLLSAAIWNRPLEAGCFEGIDKSTWNEIADMAQRQSVRALVADKVLSFPADCLPPSDMTLRFVSVVEQTKNANRVMISLLKELQEEYTRAGFPFLLLKGLANGVNYPEPLLRNPGDIDLLLYVKGDYERVREWLTRKGVDIEPGGVVHYKYKRNGIDVENHSHTTYFNNWRYNQRFTRVEEDILTQGNFATVAINAELSVSVLPVTFNAFFLFQHLFHHFVNFGVGLRQVCDWVLFLHKHQAEIDGDEFTRLAKQFALLYPMQLFARIAVDYLEAPEAIFPFPMIPNNQHADKIILDLLESGNFGFHRPGKKRPEGKMAGMWFSYVTTIKRSIKFGPISPQHCAILPFTKLITRLKIGF